MSRRRRPLGVYVHVPFCRTRCRYCDFYRVGEHRGKMDLFVAALGRQIDGLELPSDHRVDTIFFGGGTPSLLEPAEVAGILRRLAAKLDVSPEAEVSLEANPSDLSPGRLEALRAAGVGRISLGVQSLCDRELALLGRRHDARRAADAVGWARAAGFDSVSLDLMLGVPGQTAASFRRSLEGAVALGPDHLSLYILEVHADSEMDVLRRRRPRLFPGEEAERRRYRLAAERLTAAGYRHYEISNFCRPGHESRHNLKYWRCREYLGLGPAAHSLVDGRRFRQVPDLAAYLAAPTAIVAVEADLASERAFLGLRLDRGVTLAAIRRAAGLEEDELAERLERLGPFVNVNGRRAALTLEGRLLSTSVVAELLASPARPALAAERRTA